jgi:hypothetical protein
LTSIGLKAFGVGCFVRANGTTVSFQMPSLPRYHSTNAFCVARAAAEYDRIPTAFGVTFSIVHGVIHAFYVRMVVGCSIPISFEMTLRPGSRVSSAFDVSLDAITAVIRSLEYSLNVNCTS